jgi:hypothetical protein
LATTPDQLDELVRVVERWADEHADAIVAVVASAVRHDQGALTR